MHLFRGALALGGLVSLGAWSLRSPVASTRASGGCPGVTRPPRIDASPQEVYLGLAEPQTRAVVLVTDGKKPDGAFCSGAFVAPDWVITAAHCLAIPSPVVFASPGGGRPSLVLPVAYTIRHPDSDVALLKVSSSSKAQSIEPVGIAGSELASLGMGDVVEMAGYGITRSQPARALHFLVESVVSSDATTITVSGFDASGACEGDSGGPLLARGRDGSPVVVGVLSAGSAGCRGKDEYARVDTLREWVERVVATSATGNRACGGITAEGRCLYGNALWCAGNELVTTTCTSGQHCGWDRDAAGFRCVDSSTDPCGGVDSIGACRGDGTARCPNGVLQQSPCTCGATCRAHGQTGTPYCASAMR